METPQLVPGIQLGGRRRYGHQTCISHWNICRETLFLSLEVKTMRKNTEEALGWPFVKKGTHSVWKKASSLSQKQWEWAPQCNSSYWGSFQLVQRMKYTPQRIRYVFERELLFSPIPLNWKLKKTQEQRNKSNYSFNINVTSICSFDLIGFTKDKTFGMFLAPIKLSLSNLWSPEASCDILLNHYVWTL